MLIVTDFTIISLLKIWIAETKAFPLILEFLLMLFHQQSIFHYQFFKHFRSIWVSIESLPVKTKKVKYRYFIQLLCSYTYAAVESELIKHLGLPDTAHI